MLGVARLKFLGELGVRLAVLGRVPLGLAAQPPELLARARHAGLQELDQLLGAGGGGLAGGAVGAVGRLEELLRAGTDLVAQPVQLRAGRALVALRAGLLGAQVGADADLLVQLGGGPVGLAQGGQGRPSGPRRPRPSGTSSGAPAISERSARSARAVRRVSSAARWAARRSSSAARARSRQDWAPRLGLGRLVGEFAQLDLPAGPFAQPEGEPGEGVGGAAGLLGGLLPLVADPGGLGGGLVGLGPHGPRLGQLGLGLLGERAGVLGRLRQLDQSAGGAAGAPGGEPRGQFAVLAEPRGERCGSPRPARSPARAAPAAPRRRRARRAWPGSAGRGRRRRSRASGRGGRGEQGGGGADRHGRPGQQGRVAQRLAGARVGVGVGDDHAVDEFGPGGQHARVVGGVDGLGEIAPAGQGRDAVLAEELDGGQHVRAGRQQPAVAERAEDAGVVGGCRTQLEELPLGGGDGVVEQFAQFVGEAVELLRREGASAAPGAPSARRAWSRALASSPVEEQARPRSRGSAGLGLAGQAEQFRKPLLRRQRLGEAALGVVGTLRRGRGVGRTGRGQLRAGLGRGGLARVLRGPPGGLAGGVPGRDGRLLGVARREGRAGRVGVGRAVVEPARAYGLGGLLLDLGQALPQMPDLTAGALRLGGGGGGVAVRGVADLLEGGGALLLLVGEGLGALRGRRAGPVRDRRRPWRGRPARGRRPARPPGWRRTRVRHGRRRHGGAGRSRRPARRSTACARRRARASARRRTSRPPASASEACR